MEERFVQFQAIDIGTPLDQSLEAIQKEFGKALVGCHLVIIDKYFLKIKNEDSEKYANAFAAWLRRNKIMTLCIYSLAAGHGCEKFWGQLQSMCENTIDCKLKHAINMVHDRIWLSSYDFKNYTAVTVGTSFNSLGRNLCFANKLPDSDVKVLLEHSKGIISR